jgi:hypothetical protein
MRKIIIHFIFILVVTVSCSGDKDDQQTLNTKIGTWKLIEVLADPGDGSGVYTKVNSDKTVTFFASGKVESNASLCAIGNGPNQPGHGVYDEEKGIIIPDGCQSNKIRVEFKDANLFLTFLCIEPCGEKYVKVGEYIK